MRIQVAGINGMLGRAVCHAVEDFGHELIQYNPNLDAESYPEVGLGASVLINCVGIVKQSEDPDSEFMRVNAYLPHLLAEMCDDNHARFIHVSTDCVFTRDGSNSEHITPTGNDIYALSKRAGEVTRSSHLTVRTSFIGRESKHGLVYWLKTNDEVRLSKFALWTGHTVECVARLLVRFAERPDITGLLHIPGEEQTKPELARKVVKALGLSTRIIETDEMAEDRRLKSWYWSSLGIELPTFAEELQEWEESPSA